MHHIFIVRVDPDRRPIEPDAWTFESAGKRAYVCRRPGESHNALRQRAAQLATSKVIRHHEVPDHAD